MDNKKFEQLIELIINEDQDAAKALFHDIVVEKSREIYESIMDEEMDEGMGGQVGSMLDEISAEESGMTENDEDLEGDAEPIDGEMDDEMDDDEVVDLDAADDEGDEEDRIEDLEDRVVSAEEKLEKLMAEFEDILAGEDDDMEDEEAIDDEEEAVDDEEMAADDEEEAADDEEEADEMMESKLVAVKKPAGGDSGANSRSPVAAKAKVPSPARAVDFSEGNAAGRSTPAVKPGKSYGNTGLGHKPRLTAAPQPVKKDTTHSRSPLGESKKPRAR